MGKHVEETGRLPAGVLDNALDRALGLCDNALRFPCGLTWVRDDFRIRPRTSGIDLCQALAGHYIVGSLRQ